MNHKHKHTLEGIFKKQVSGNIHWHDVESLLEALGAELQTAHGARMTYMLNGAVGTISKPHRSSVMSKQEVRHLRDFLQTLGVSGP